MLESQTCAQQRSVVEVDRATTTKRSHQMHNVVRITTTNPALGNIIGTKQDVLLFNQSGASNCKPEVMVGDKAGFGQSLPEEI